MMLTRKEADGTWCPMVRLAACTPDGGVEQGQSVFNRLQKGNETAIPDSGRCIADKCAMWRWESDPIKLPIVVGREANDAQIAAHRGYCGLAGVPLFAGGAA